MPKRYPSRAPCPKTGFKNFGPVGLLWGAHFKLLMYRPLFLPTGWNVVLKICTDMLGEGTNLVRVAKNGTRFGLVLSKWRGQTYCWSNFGIADRTLAVLWLYSGTFETVRVYFSRVPKCTDLVEGLGFDSHHQPTSFDFLGIVSNFLQDDRIWPHLIMRTPCDVGQLKRSASEITTTNSATMCGNHGAGVHGQRRFSVKMLSSAQDRFCLLVGTCTARIPASLLSLVRVRIQRSPESQRG